MNRRVVVTGLGAVTPVGNDVPTMWASLVAGKSGIGHITRFDASAIGMEVLIAAEVKGFDPRERFGRRKARRNDLFALYGLASACEAVEDAGLALEEEQDKKKVGVLIGTGIGGVLTLLENYDVLNESGPRRISPLMVPMMMSNAATAAVSIEYGLKGPSMSVASACATGNNAIGESAEMIRYGRAEVMICGGSDAVMHPVSLSGFKNMGALSTRNDDPAHACRPFDAERDGFVMGEGAGILILESLEHARSRGAHIYAEFIGHGASSDGTHITAPDEEGRGAARAMNRALADAALDPEAVDYVNAHGTSTSLNDAMETRAIRRTFGPHAEQLAISSNKSMIGHLLGAAGAVEAIATVKTLETGWVPPTINYEHPDPDCDLNYVPNEAQELQPKVVISNSFGFGGHNACVVFRRWEESV